MRDISLHDLQTDRVSGHAGHSFTITRFPYLIGRQPDCDGRFGALWVSRRHCRFFLVKDDVWVEDLGSRNGTFVNGEELRCPRLVQDGDRIELAGMAFQVQLQAASAAPAPGQPGAGNTAPDERSRRQILVVEDNTSMAETLAMLLRQWGHEVAVARDGPEAITLALENHPKTVLVNIGSPAMDGYEIAKRLRTQAGLQEALLIAMTGRQDEVNASRSEDAGLHALLTKPVTPDALRELIECFP
jgi:CheY-like chemotaxis protein